MTAMAAWQIEFKYSVFHLFFRLFPWFVTVTAVGDHFERHNDGFKREIQSIYCVRSTSK